LRSIQKSYSCGTISEFLIQGKLQELPKTLRLIGGEDKEIFKEKLKSSFKR